MPKSKNRKDHKKKLAIRNEKIRHEKDKFKRYHRDMMMKMIEEEKKKGMFDNTPDFPIGPQISGDSQIIDGPLL